MCLGPDIVWDLIATMLKQAFKNTTEGVYLRTRMDGDLFNLQRLKPLKNNYIGPTQTTDMEAANSLHGDGRILF